MLFRSEIRRYVLSRFPFVIYHRWEPQHERVTIPSSRCPVFGLFAPSRLRVSPFPRAKSRSREVPNEPASAASSPLTLSSGRLQWVAEIGPIGHFAHLETHFDHALAGEASRVVSGCWTRSVDHPCAIDCSRHLYWALDSDCDCQRQDRGILEWRQIVYPRGTVWVVRGYSMPTFWLNHTLPRVAEAIARRPERTRLRCPAHRSHLHPCSYRGSLSPGRYPVFEHENSSFKSLSGFRLLRAFAASRESFPTWPVRWVEQWRFRLSQIPAQIGRAHV